jgi:hypothetical protein
MSHPSAFKTPEGEARYLAAYDAIPSEPIRDVVDYVAWLTATLDGLHVDRIARPC